MNASSHPARVNRVPSPVWMSLAWGASAVFAAAVLVTLPDAGNRFPGGFGGLAAAAALPAGLLLARRNWVAAFTVLLAESLSFVIAEHGNDRIAHLQFLVATVILGFIAATRPRRASVAAAVAVVGVLAAFAVVPLLADHSHVDAASLPPLALSVVVALVVGDSVRQRLAHAETLRVHAAAQAVVAERLRIAREMHDMVAHSIGIIAIQAGTASRVIDTQPAEARNSLAAIEATSRDTLRGLRRMLGVLRPADSDQPQRDPTPGLADLDRLAATSAEAGVRVEVSWHGQCRPLPAEIDLSVFRIIQEAITNVVRHAGTSCCRVSVEYQQDTVSVEVVDDGRGCPMERTGYGLTGMGERVSLLHGQFDAGPRPEGGFRVAARLPG